MGSFLEDAMCVAAGYAIKGIVDNRREKNSEISTPISDNLEDIVHDYAHRHDIWGRDMNMYRRLTELAKEFYDPYAIEEDTRTW